MYDHHDETRHWYTVAASLRAQAAEVRSEAERQARWLERDALQKEQLAANICRLCAGVNANCCVNPQSPIEDK